MDGKRELQKDWYEVGDSGALRAITPDVYRHRRRGALCVGTIGVCLMALAIFAVGRPAPAHGATFTVDATHDAVDANPGDGVCADIGGACTLRAAVMEVHTSGPSFDARDTISIPPGTYVLTLSGSQEDVGLTGDLDVRYSMKIIGSGAGSTIIDGGGLDRVFHIQSTLWGVDISDLTIQNGLAADPDLGGGGVAVGSGAFVFIDRVVMTDNRATSQPGGAIYNAWYLAVRASTLNNNTAQRGGAIYGTGVNGLGLVHTTVSGNTAAAGGCSLEAETVPNAYPQSMASVTVYGAASSPGCSAQVIGPWIMRRTIIAAGGAGSACGGAVSSARDNLDSDGSCGLNSLGDLSNVDPKLGPLAENGGPTRTHALLAGSPAIDAAHDVEGELCDVAPYDQRGAGFPRRSDGNGDGVALCDIGAFELQPPAATPTPATPTPSPVATPPARIALPNTGGESGENGASPAPVIAVLSASILAVAVLGLLRRISRRG